MVHRFELFHEGGLDLVDVAEGQRGVAHESVGYLPVDDLIDQCADRLVGVFVEAARSRLDGIGHHQDRRLTGEGVRAGVGEERLVDGFAGVGVTVGVVEILGLTGAVVRADKVDDGLGQACLFGHFDALGDVADDDLCTLLEGQIAVGVDALHLVLGEERRVLHLADIVIERSGADQLRVGADLGAGGGGQNGDLQGVLEGAGAGLGELFEQRGIDVRQLHERNGRDVSEGLFHHINEDVGEHEQHEVDAEIDPHAPIDLVEVAVLIEREADVAQHVGQRDEEGASQELRSLRKLLEADDEDDAGHDLQQ